MTKLTIDKSYKLIKIPRFLFLIWIISVGFLDIGVYILSAVKQSKGYEPSIYAALPNTFWLFILLSSLGGIVAVILPGLNPRFSKSNFWFIGFSIVVFIIILFFLLPLIRGYSAYGRSDIMIHAGRVQDIISTGHLPEYDRPSSKLLYPAPIYIMTFLSSLLDVNPLNLVQFSTLTLFVLNLLFTYLLSKEILVGQPAVAISMISSCILFFSSLNYEVWPTMLGFTLVPFVLWLYFRVIFTNSIVYRLILIFVCIGVVFIHPIVCMSFIIGLTAMEVYRTKFYKNDKTTNVMNVVLILVISLITWLTLNLFFWSMTVTEIINLITAIGEGGATRTIQQLGTINVSPLESIVLLIRINGQDFIYIGLAVIGSIFAFRYKNIDSQARKITLLNLFLYSQFIILVAFLFGGSRSVSYWRSLVPIVIISPIFLGFLGSLVIKKYVYKTQKGLLIRRIILVISIVGTVFISYIIGLFGYYPSPSTYRVNQQISNAELSGMGWFIMNRDYSIPLDSITLKYVFPSALNGYSYVDKNPTPNQQKWGETLNFPDHLDYSLGRKPIESFKLYYLPISNYDRFYQTIIPRKPVRITQDDFLRMENETNFEKIYSNGDLDLWLVFSEALQK